MSLKDRLGLANATDTTSLRKILFKNFGVVRNPFPPAGEPSGHPHLETPVEDKIVGAVKNFNRDRTSQVLIVQGTQGVGKTNLLNYYQVELERLYEESEGFYIIRYYPDPESSFEGIIRRLFQEFHQSGLLQKIGEALAHLDRPKRDAIIDIALSHEVRVVLNSLSKAASSAEDLSRTAELAFEWLTGMRVLNKHREQIGIHFRLDTVESKTQALRDLVFCSSSLDLLKGIFLLLDELEKQDYSLSKTVVLRYLSAIRALIDALPRHLFLLIALTIEARRRYFSMLPAFAGRLQNVVELKPLQSADDAMALCDFYFERAREQAAEEVTKAWGSAGTAPIQTRVEVRDLFSVLTKQAAARGQEGVTQRDFLNVLHAKTEQKFQSEDLPRAPKAPRG